MSVFRQCNRAVLLLEVVVALAIMVVAMGLLGAQLIGGLRMTGDAEELTRASQLADRVLALLELDPNTVERFVEYREVDGDFDEQYPGWFWRAVSEKLEEVELTEQIREEPRLSRVTIQILHQRDPDRLDDIEDAHVVRQLHLLKAARGTIDLERDFGLPAENAEMLKANLPPEVLTEDGEIDFAKLVQYVGADLFSLLPMFMGLAQQAGGVAGLGEGFSAEALAGMAGEGGFSPDELMGLLTGGAGGGDGGAGGNEAIAEMLRSQLGGQLTEEQLSNLLSMVGQGRGGAGAGRGGGGGSGGRAGRGGGGGRGGRGGQAADGGPGDEGPSVEPRRGRGIEDLARERDERNRKSEGR
jgi:hypothetical protein